MHFTGGENTCSGRYSPAFFLLVVGKFCYKSKLVDFPDNVFKDA